MAVCQSTIRLHLYNNWPFRPVPLPETLMVTQFYRPNHPFVIVSKKGVLIPKA